MDALSMIEMGMHTSDPVAPARNTLKRDQQFGVVLNKKQQPSQQHESKPVTKPANRQPETSAGSKDQQVIAHNHNHKTEMKDEITEQKELLNEVVVASSPQPEVEEQPKLQAKVQHALIDLLKTMVKGEPMKSAEISESIEPLLTGGSMEVEKNSADIETLLNDLVQQLDLTDLNGEQVLAGVDLSGFAEKQLNHDTSLLQNIELAAPVMTESPQQDIAPVVIENLAQARQMLQKAFDSVVLQKSPTVEGSVAEENVAVAGQQSGETFFLMEETAEEIDPRFAGLLNPRTEQRPVGQQTRTTREQVQLHNSKQPVELKHSESADLLSAEKMVAQKQREETVQLPVGSAKQMLENLTHQAPSHLQSQGQVPVQGMDASRTMLPTNPVVQLASGQQVTESQIFDQVVTQLSGSVNGESGRMVLRLQPAELGSLRLELIVEGDRIKANLHAQNHQVQEVLERNLPQLRNALAAQGLKIDQFQVNTDQHQQSSQFENLAQQNQHNGSEKKPSWHQQNLESEEQIIPLAHLMQNGGGGISLHV
ncbi:MAG: flagellar hook-length control protein FliK [Desulfuromusa sp.]|nr:flagellar hook-length control protein FliK [Desulfuromusa sp.]